VDDTIRLVFREISRGAWRVFNDGAPVVCCVAPGVEHAWSGL